MLQTLAPHPLLPGPRTKLALTVVATLVLSGLVIGHVSGMNGPWYWKWPWKAVDTLRIYPLSLVAALPLFGALFIFERRTTGVVWTLASMMLTCLLLQFVILGTESNPFSLDKIANVTASPGATGYFIAAERLSGDPDFLARYPELMPGLPFHASTKPPGIVLYNLVVIRLFGVSHSATMVSGTVIGFLAAFVVPATYWLSRTLGAGAPASLYAAAVMALSPSIANCLPEFDQVYPIATCALVALWVLALERNRPAFSATFGLVLAGATFFAYNLLVLGFILAGLTVWYIFRMSTIAVVKHVGVALGVFTICYLAVWVLTGFNAVTTFESALARQDHLLTLIARPYPATVLFDLTDLAMGLAWIPFLWIVFDVVESGRRGESAALLLTALAIAQVLVMAISGLLPGETFRVWTFVLPLLACPAGRELWRWSSGARMAALACVWLLTTAIAQNIVFVAA